MSRDCRRICHACTLSRAHTPCFAVLKIHACEKGALRVCVCVCVSSSGYRSTTSFRRSIDQSDGSRGSASSVHHRSGRRPSTDDELAEGRPDVVGCRWRWSIPHPDGRRLVVVANSGREARRFGVVPVLGRQRRRHRRQQGTTGGSGYVY